MNTHTSGRVLITGAPFAAIDRDPLRVLEEQRIPYSINPTGRRLTEHELIELIGPYEVLVASTEPITERVLDAASSNLRLIARVGIGLDNVPLEAARTRGIAVAYTPDAPTAAVAELTMAQILALLRHTAAADRDMRQGVWHRRIGRSLSHMTVGVIGAGRVGRNVIRKLRNWGASRILANDLLTDPHFSEETGCHWVEVERILQEADILTLHVPLTKVTQGMIGEDELSSMKPDAILINTSRGGIVDEAALAEALRRRPQFSAAVDVFVDEPYSGELLTLQNCLLSCHMGAATRDTRLRMEMEAIEEVVRYFRNESLRNPVPEYEYVLQTEIRRPPERHT